MNNTLFQPASFLIMLYSGIVLGLVSACLSALCGRFQGKRFRVFCDLLLAGCFFVTAGIGFLIATRGVLRLYGFAALALGAHLARISFGALLRKVTLRAPKQGDSGKTRLNSKFSRAGA